MGLLCGGYGKRKLSMVSCHTSHIYGIWDLDEQRGGGCFKVTIWAGNASHKRGR